jgi:hypothetical protein
MIRRTCLQVVGNNLISFQVEVLMFKIADANRALGFPGLSALLVLVCAGAALAQTTSFTYQGRLPDGATPANGVYEIQFTLWDAIAGGTQQPQPAPIVITRTNVQVSAGAFTVQSLDFGANAFPGGNRYLEIRVRRKSLEPFTTLSPRQEISATPYAIRAMSAAQAMSLWIQTSSAALTPASTPRQPASEILSSGIRRTPQAGATLNIDGNGTIGGTFQAGAVRAQTARGLYGLTHTDGTTTVGTYVGGSSSGAEGGWFGTQSNDKLFLFTNNGQPTMTVDTTGNVGIGTTTPRATLDVAGNAVQDRDKGGMVKAMLYVDGTLVNPTILRCYNGVTGASTGNCGFTVILLSNGSYEIGFGFQVSDRFVSITASLGKPPLIGLSFLNMGSNFSFNSQDNTVLRVHTFYSTNADIRHDAAFMLIVY